MKNLKLSLKKEIISSLEAKNVVGGRPEMPLTMCTPDGPNCELKSVLVCPTNGCSDSCACGGTLVSNIPQNCPSVISDSCPI